MRLNLINYVQILETTTVPQIAGKFGEQGKPGRCAMGLLYEPMVETNPERYSISLDDDRYYGIHLSDNQSNPRLHPLGVISEYLGISKNHACEIASRSNEGMTFKELSSYVASKFLTKEEKALLKQMKASKQEAEVILQ